MTASRRSGAARWRTIEPRLARLTDGELRDLLRDLFDLSEANRTYLNAHLLSQSERERRLEELRHDLARASRAAGRGTAIRSLLRAYVRATADRTGAALLLARHLRTLLTSMRESGALRPGGGFAALVGELARLVGGHKVELEGDLERELTTLIEAAGRVDENLSESIAERVVRQSR